MLKNKNINKLKLEIKQKHPVVYEADLKNDIDYAKAPQNELKQTEEYLEFICETGIEISKNDFEIIFGGLEKKDEQFYGILQKQSFYKSETSPDGEKFFSATLPLHDKYDLLNISFRGKPKQRFKMSAYNGYLYQIKKDVAAGVFGDSEENQSYKERLSSLQAQAIIFDYESENNLSIFTGNKLAECIFLKYDCQDIVSFSLDYKSKKININNQKWRDVYDVDFKILNYFEISASLPNDALFPDNSGFYIYNVKYAKNNGYIYLKPISLSKGKYKIFLYYTGEVTLEYFKGENGDWEILSENLRLTEKQDLRFRINMNSGNKLYDMFIVNEDFKR